jgi:hypothetical protein
MELPADPGLTLTIYTGQPGSPTEEKFSLLASWTATETPAQPDTTAGKT